MQFLTNTFRLGSRLVCLAVLVIISGTSIAAIPHLINFQGILRDGSGNPVADGSYSVTFAIYKAETGGAPLYQESYTVTILGGLFNVAIGSGPLSIPDSVFDDTTRYLGVKVGADPEMTPRQRLISQPYGYRVSSVDGANGGSINGSLSFGSSNTPMLYMFETGSPVNGRMLIAHSTSFDTWGLYYDGLTDKMSFKTNIGPALTVDLLQRKVGVGTDSPSDLLDVAGGVNVDYLSQNVGTVSNALRFGDLNSGEGIGSRRDGAGGSWGLDFYTLYINRLSISQGGNVGIGTTAPSEKLEVNGNFKVTGDIIGSTAWTSFPFASGYGNTGVVGVQVAQYRKIGDVVYFRGYVHKLDNSSIGSGAILGNLTSGFIPPASIGFPPASPNESIGINSLGWVQGYSSSSSVSLNGISFSVAP